MQRNAEKCREMQINADKCREMLEKFREMQRNVQCAICMVNVIHTKALHNWFCFVC